MLEFRMLGPLDVLDDGRTIGLGGARQRAVLAILLLHRGETVSVDRIVDLMWGERPPATASRPCRSTCRTSAARSSRTSSPARAADTRSSSIVSGSTRCALTGS